MDAAKHLSPSQREGAGMRTYAKVEKQGFLMLGHLVFYDLFDLTLRQAVRELQRNGFGIGNLEYQSDIATNKVLAYKINGIPIETGQELYYGTVIDLVVAQGISDETVLIPNLIGLSRIEANIILKSTSLNIGLEHFNNDVFDSNSAIIYKQFPVLDSIDENNMIKMKVQN